MENNYALALGRLRSLHQKLDAEAFSEYDSIIRAQLQEGIIEKVESNEEKRKEAYYLPHKAIFTPEKTTKVRVVYDGSARPSKLKNLLNDVIYKGSNLLENLVAIFLRFRFHRIAILSDIEKAFLQLLIDESDRNYVRFLWFDNYSPLFASSKIVVYRFARVAFSIIASPFLYTR